MRCNKHRFHLWRLERSYHSAHTVMSVIFKNAVNAFQVMNLSSIFGPVLTAERLLQPTQSHQPVLLF